MNYIDLHSHAHMRAYARSFSKNLQHSNNAQDEHCAWHTWHITVGNKFLQNFGITKFSQSDFNLCIKGNVGMVFSSITPFEKGYTRVNIKNKDLRRLILTFANSFGKARIKFTENLDDYFIDLQQEYQFLRQLHGKMVDGKSYRLVTNFADAKKAFNRKNQIAVINTIEGAYAFGTGIAMDFNTKARCDQVLQNIGTVKAWEHPPFFVTLGHHFYNEICGHALTVPKAMARIVNQEMGSTFGFSKNGKKFMEALLSSANGNSIIIDSKHMNLRSRKQYYAHVKKMNIDKPPIFVSHGGCTGYKNVHAGKATLSKFPSANQQFYSQEINFYDFEFPLFEKSGGVLGVQLDERRIASLNVLKKIKKLDSREYELQYAKLVWKQIWHIARVLDDAELFAWGIQCIGSDFDGIIDPMNKYYTVASYPTLFNYLEGFAKEYLARHVGDFRVAANRNITAEEIVQRLACDNVLKFLGRFF